MYDIFRSNVMSKALLRYLGDLPNIEGPPRVMRKTVTQESWAYREDLLLDLNGIEPVPAVCFLPRRQGPHPVIIYAHAHGGAYSIGKRELYEGIPYMQDPPYAEVLTSLGFGVICIDSWGFGERHLRSESELFKEFLWKGSTLWGMMVYDTLRLVEYLHLRDDINRHCIGIMGMSMGSTMAWWCASLDQRIAFCIDLCCLTDFDELIRSGGIDLHGLYYYVPGLLKEFSASSIIAMAAPRRHFSLVGSRDPLTPMKGVEKIHKSVKQAYTEAGTPESWKLNIYDCGHEETPQMRSDITAYLKELPSIP